MSDFATMFMLVRIAIVGILLWLLYRAVRSGIARVRGDRERAKRLRGQLIGFVIAFVLLWPFTGIRLQQSYLEWRYRSHMYEIAETLGYVAEDFLFEGSGCWDPVLTFYPLGRERCGIFLYFTTDLNVDELEPLVLQLPSPNLSESEGFTDVADVFDYMFYRTSDYSALTLDGKEMSKQDLSSRSRHKSLHR